jgi:hypothetical protein
MVFPKTISRSIRSWLPGGEPATSHIGQQTSPGGRTRVRCVPRAGKVGRPEVKDPVRRKCHLHLRSGGVEGIQRTGLVAATTKNPHPHLESETDRGDAQSWYFLGLPLGLDVFPGMSGAGRTPERSGKPRPAPVSKPGAWLKSSESDPKTEAVEAPVAGDLDKTLSCSCPAQKRKNFVSRGQEHSTALRVPCRLGGKS